MEVNRISNSHNNKRITKNTLILYIRMFFRMGVSLYTSRIVLQALGVADYGIYNIVGGIVVLFSFLNTAMSSGTQRFLNFELGRGDDNEVQRVFSMSMTAHISIAIFVIILGETVGLWFLNTHLNIPAGRMYAANWVYQFSILTFCLQIIRVPYNATIIAYEKMSFYAYVSIAEVTLKLLSVFMLLYFSFDKLILYSILSFGVVLTTVIIYKIYCNKTFKTSLYYFFWDSKLYKKLMSFSGWSLFGSLANVGAQEGLDILVNIFLGVTINAAMGVAQNVSTSIYGFVSNFQVAFKPQLIKSYASNDREYFMDLIFRSSKFSYFLLFLIASPLLFQMEFILKVWLHIVPAHSAAFCRLIILYLLIDAISAPLWMAVQATGEIRNYQILMGFLILINIPLAYVMLKLGFAPESVLIVKLLLNFISLFVRIFYLRPKVGLPVKRYFAEVLLPVAIVTIMSLPLPFIIIHYSEGWNGLFITTAVTVISILALIYLFGLKNGEKRFVKEFVINKIRR